MSHVEHELYIYISQKRLLGVIRSKYTVLQQELYVIVYKRQQHAVMSGSHRFFIFVYGGNADILYLYKGLGGSY